MNNLSKIITLMLALLCSAHLPAQERMNGRKAAKMEKKWEKEQRKEERKQEKKREKEGNKPYQKRR